MVVSIEDWRTKVGFEINDKKLEGGMQNVRLRFRMEKFLTIEVGVVIIDTYSLMHLSISIINLGINFLLVLYMMLN